MAAFLLLQCALKQGQKQHALPTQWVQQGYTARLLPDLLGNLSLFPDTNTDSWNISTSHFPGNIQ